ncbi:hypothetical protein D3C71_2039210 [compost metagenome]
MLIGTVKADVAPVCAFVEQRHRNGVNQRLLEIQLLRHAGLQHLLVVDVHVDTHHTHGAARLIAENAGGGQKPPYLAIRPDDAP